jgi:hypothetical protein
VIRVRGDDVIQGMSVIGMGKKGEKNRVCIAGRIQQNENEKNCFNPSKKGRKKKPEKKGSGTRTPPPLKFVQKTHTDFFPACAPKGMNLGLVNRNMLYPTRLYPTHRAASPR